MSPENFKQDLHWTRIQMPILARALTHLPDLTEVRLACSMHLEIKMVPLIEGILHKGAKVFLTTCNPGTVRNEVVEYLKAQGAETFAWRDMSEEEQSRSFDEALNWDPSHLCEMGADLSSALQSRQPAANLEAKRPNSIKASLEATGSGISRLQLITPPYPIFNWDDVPVKEGLHNRHMVGLMAWNAFLSRTSLTLHGKRVAVIGYGLVGTGVAETARAFGGAVSVIENDPSRILQAKYAGWEVLSLEEALPKVDVVVTATGASSVLNEKHFPLLKDGAFLINVGHHSKEIDVSALFRYPHQEILPFVTAVTQEKSTIYLFANGSMANLVAGKGDSLNSFDVILGIMVAGISHIVGAGTLASPGIHLLPPKVWEKVL